MHKNREVNTVAKKNKVQENFKTPNEKFNAEFAEDTSIASNPKGNSKVQENFKTPNEKFNAEFAEDTSIASNPKGNSKVQENFKKPNEKFDAEFGELNTPGDHSANR
ncbi:hypothetical protein C169_10173 [Paenibacillus sp. FSL R5-808]|nr:hypothetical protein C169_10173 [Paenibacillus sp. FSL R5-808]